MHSAASATVARPGASWPTLYVPTTLTMVAPPFALFERWALGTLHPRDAARGTPRWFVSHRPPNRSRMGGAFVGVRRTWWLAGSRRASECVVPAALGFHPELSQSLRPRPSLLPPPRGSCWARTRSSPDPEGCNVHPSHWHVITVLSLPSSVAIKLTRWAYLSATEPPDAKSCNPEYFVYKFFKTKDFGPLSRVNLSFHKTGGEGGYLPTAHRLRLCGGVAFPPFENREGWRPFLRGSGSS
jgi:hypothetical protein